MIPCSVSPNFAFYQYIVECKDKRGKDIASRGRRAAIFELGIFDPAGGYIARNFPDMTEKEVKDLKRVVFFQGSYAFSGRPLPGVEERLREGGSLPLVGADGCPTSADADMMSITAASAFCAPAEMQIQQKREAQVQPSQQQRAAPQAAEPSLASSMQTLTLDLRCSDCVHTFVDQNALFMHCRETGHFPVTSGSGDGVVRPASKEDFCQYANVVLGRALGERLARW